MQDVVLDRLSLVHFKNHAQADFSFSAKLNALVGANGSGKTSVLDAVHVLCMTRSYFHSSDSYCIQFDAPFLVVQGEFRGDTSPTPVYCGLKRGDKKIFKADDAEYPRISDHLGRFPVVMISPGDHVLLHGGSEVRRKMMDAVIAQSDRAYLEALQGYQRALKQRNALLKYFAANRIFQPDMIEVYDHQLSEFAPLIYEARTRFVQQFAPMLQEAYLGISGDREKVELRYESSLEHQSMADLLAERLPKDRLLQFTSAGPHREDLDFIIHGHPLQRVGSQGQQKSFLIALKLASFEVLHQALGRKPILLLDDVFDKLDAQRVEGLVRMVNDQRFGQIFISDTHQERTADLLKALDQESVVHDFTPN